MVHPSILTDLKTPVVYREADKMLICQRAAPTRSAFGMLEPYEGKLSSTVLRGEWDSNVPDLPDQYCNAIYKNA